MVTPLDLLIDLGAGDVEHPGGTLLAHLLRVEARLGEWGADQAVRRAGLCHAVYGTDGFGTALLELSERAVVRRVIGTQAEELVYFYASCDRGALTADRFRDRFTGTLHRPRPDLLRSFMEITAANELDVAEHSAEIRRRHGAALSEFFDDHRALLSEEAARTCHAFHWTGP
ncbi:DUF6817 domain-containing protein [Nonomuraea endophytica]|uniref:DUF6817 domain-containing protein n=1 Tax=Nonomuraea endophytica TaxID=714136 RepID=A0A7W8A324_9ACTN|nr:hypothetical protein [Nonomuraea endophytica]MBB5078613.1 hypothetical protein [Nonomuraea endophytica]